MICFWIAKNHRRLLQCTAGFVVGSFLFTTICAPFVEANVWKERKSYLQMAQAPINPQPFPLVELSQVSTQKFSAKYNIPTASLQLTEIAHSLSSLPGTIRKISVPQKGKQGPIVLHIQDVHLNQEAQGNIGKTIQGLVNADKISLVALEGAFEKIDLGRFRRSSYPEAIQKVADYLLRESKISGAIHTAFTSKKEIPPMVGIDDETHYHANVDAYKKSYKLASRNLKNFQAIESELENEKGKLFNANLKVFDQKVQSFHAGKIKLAEYLNFLVEARRCEKQNIERPNSQDEIVLKENSQDKTVQNFLKCARIESSLDFKKVEKERSQLIQALVRNLNESQIEELTQQSLAYRLGRIGYAEYYSYLQNLCKSSGVLLHQYPAMAQYIQYTILADSINSEKFFKKIKEIEEEGYEHLAKTALEKELVFKSKQSYLTRKLLEFTLTPEEWKEYEKLRGHFLNLSRKAQSFSESRRHSLLDLKFFEDFYTEAKIRDQAMAENLLREIDLHGLGVNTVHSSVKTSNKEFKETQSRKEESRVVVLVTGGFHSEGIENRLIQEGITVINFAPKMTKVEIEKGAAHLTVFTQEKTPLEKLFKGEKLTLPPKTFPKQLLPIAAALVIGFLAIWSPQMTTPAQANTVNRILLGQAVAEEIKVEKVKWLEPRTSQLFFQKPNGTVKVTVNSNEKKDITVKEENISRAIGQPGALGLWKILGLKLDLTVIAIIEGFIIVYAMALFMPYTSPEFTYEFISLIAQRTLLSILTVYSITFLLHLFSGVQQPSGKILRWSFFKGSDARFEKVSFREAFHAGLEATNNATFKSAFQIFPLLWISVFLPSPWSYLVAVIATIFGTLPHFFINERIKQAYGTFNLDVLIETYDSPNRIEDGEEDHRYVYDPIMKKVILNQMEIEMAFPHKSEFVHTRNEINEIFQKLIESASELLEEKGKMEQLAGLREMKIYLSDTLTPNAFAFIHHNFMILNIGTLKQLSQKGLLSKDAVAFILAHELSHMLQYRDDVDEGKINREKVNFRSWKETIKEKFYENKERYTQEQDADIRALEIVNRAGYNMSATVSFFESIQKNPFIFEQMFHEHPSPHTRIDYIKKILRASNWRESQTLENFSNAVLEEVNGPQSLMRRRQQELSSIVNQKDLEFAIENAQTIEELDLIVSWSLSRLLELESKKIAPLVLKLLLKRKDKVLKGLFRFVVKASRIDLYSHLWIHKSARYKENRYESQGLFWLLFTKMSLIKKSFSYFILTYLVTDSLPIYEAYDRTKGAYSTVPLFIDGYDRLFNAIKEAPMIQERINLRNQILQKIRAKAVELENGNEKSIELIRLEALRMNPLLLSNASFSGERYDIPFTYGQDRITKEKIRKIEKGVEGVISQYSYQELTIFLKQMLPFRGMGFEYIRIWDEDARSDFKNYLVDVTGARRSVYEVMVSFMLKRLVLDLKNPSSAQLLELLDLLLVKKREFLGLPTPKIDLVARWILKRIRKTITQTNQNQREERLKVKQYFADHWQLYPLREVGEFFYEELLVDPEDPLTLELLQKSENLRNNVFSVLIRTLKGANARELLFEDEVMNYQMERAIRFFRLNDAQITLLHAAVAQKIVQSRREDQSRNRLIEIQESFSSLERSGINEKPLEHDPLSKQLAELLFDQGQLEENSSVNIFGLVSDHNRATQNRLNASEIETVNQKVREALDEAGLSTNDLASVNFEIKKIIYFFYLGGLHEADFLIRFTRAAYKRRSIPQNDLELLAQFLNSPSFLEKQKTRGLPKTFSAERVRWKGFGRFLRSEESASPDMFLVMKPFYRAQTWGEYIVSFNLMVYLKRTKQKRLVRFLIDSLFLKKISSISSMFLGELWGGDDSDWTSDGATTSKFLMRIFESAFSKIIFGAPKYIDRRDLALDSSWKRFFFTLVFKSKMNFEELLSEIKTYFPEGTFRNFLLFYLLAKRIHELDPSFKLKRLPEPKDLKEFFLESSQFLKEKTLILEAVEKIIPLLIRDHRIDFINLKLLSYWFLKKEGKKRSGLGENEKRSVYDFFIDLGSYFDLLVWGLEKLYELWKKSDLYTFLTFTVHLINYVLILPFYVLSEARLLPKFFYKLVVCILLIKSPFEDTDRAYLSLKNRVMEIVLSEIYRERWLMRLFRRAYLWFQLRFRSKEKLNSIFYFDFQGKQVHLDSSIPDFVERDLMAIIHRPELSFETKKETIQRFFPIETPTRDKYLENLAEEEISRTDQTQDDLLDHLKSLRTLFANPYLKDHYSLICLELERKIHHLLYKKSEHLGIDPAKHYELIFNYVKLIESYFDVGYIRDDLLFSVLEEARTHEEYLLIRPYFYQYRMNGIQNKKKADSFYYQDRIALLLQEAKAEEKKELLLWLLGFQEKPLFLSEWEIFVKTDLSQLKEVFRGNGHLPFKEERDTLSFSNTGHSLRKEMVRQLLVGNKGILTDKKIFESMMNTIFDSIVSKGGEISKKKIKKIMRSVIRNLDDERLIEMTQALSVTLSLSEGGEDESVVIAKFFESLGVIGIKLAQVLAHSYDIQISEQLRDRLRDLSSGADPVNKILAFETIQNIYPGGFNAHFDTLGDMIGSASVKVVYKVNRKGMEKPHVLKIKRPDVSQRIEKDLEFLKNILKDLRKKGFSISPGLENEVAKAIRSDADFKREFQITEEFREQLQRIQEEEYYHLTDQTPVEFSVARIHAGSIQSDATMETDLAEGVSLDKQNELIQSGILSESDYVEVKRIILDFLMKQLFQYGFYLSDPHGGNFHIVREEGKIKIILIDNGSGEKLQEGEKNKEELLEAMIWLSINSGRRIPNQYLSASIFFGKLGYLKKDLTNLEFLSAIFKYLKISGTREDGSSFILTPEEYMETIKEKFAQEMTVREKIRFFLRKRAEQPGAILVAVKIPAVALLQRLLPKKWSSWVPYIYDLFIVFWLENLLLHYFVKPHLPLILHALSPFLHVLGLDSISLNAALWGLFFGLHLIEFFLFSFINWLEHALSQTQRFPRAPPKGNILASGIVSLLSAFFTSSPTSLESFGIHFLVNFAAFLISINIYGLIKNRIVNAIEFLEQFQNFQWSELAGPSDTAEHLKPAVQTFGNDAEFALEISEDAFEESGKGRIFFDRAQNHIYLDDQEIEFGSQALSKLMSNIAALKEKYEENHKDYEVLAVLPNGNLGFNDWFVGIINGKVYRHAKEPLRDRTYSMVVTKTDGTSSTMELHFKEISGTIRAFDEKDRDITGQIQYAFFGQQIVKDG